MHHDIIHTHILARLDATTLASAAATCSHLRRLCTDNHLWQNIAAATWPSLLDPTTCHVISTFPKGHRSIFSDSFPALHHYSSHSNHPPSPPPPWIYTIKLAPMPVKFVRKEEEWIKHLEDNLCLSWILIDPTGKRSMNVSSRKPVLVRRHWLTRDVEILFSVIMAGEARRATEMVQCMVKVTCCGKVGGGLHVRELNLVMEDMEGGKVNGKEGVGILMKAMEFGERKIVGEEGEMKERFERFLSLVRERREKKFRRQKERDGVSMVVAFVVCVWFCYLASF
ncbi:hypothetical protein P8452_36383 [Trifolium repens]|nr:hypothetical protein P8452_36383 [Trifolium repens]